MESVLARIEGDDDATRHASALSSVVVELTETGLDYYFLRPLQESKFGFVARQTANLGVSGTLRVMSPIIGRILASADTPQLRGGEAPPNKGANLTVSRPTARQEWVSFDRLRHAWTHVPSSAPVQPCGRRG